MTISDEEAAAAWKKAQGQVRGKTDLEHIKPALIIFPLAFVGTFAMAHFGGGFSIGESLLFAPITALLATARVLFRWRRSR
jgi:hypothetical protein